MFLLPYMQFVMLVFSVRHANIGCSNPCTPRQFLLYFIYKNERIKQYILYTLYWEGKNNQFLAALVSKRFQRLYHKFVFEKCQLLQKAEIIFIARWTSTLSREGLWCRTQPGPFRVIILTFSLQSMIAKIF